MIASTCGALLLLSQATLGGHEPRRLAPSRCERCQADRGEIFREIATLQNDPSPRHRDHAAHALRRYSWRCHPEVVGVLANSLLNDRDEEVREESAQALARMAPCLPEAHQALRIAAERDPDRSTRRWARKALESLRGECAGPCLICQPATLPTASPLTGPVVAPPEPALRPEAATIPAPASRPVESVPAGPLPPLEAPASSSVGAGDPTGSVAAEPPLEIPPAASTEASPPSR